ncbi:n-terminal binuclear zn cluster-containing dna binding domain-containing [Trichoderma cornu-damae]|uniref:N-terminal binuclear zn cluster-containing dna binding domain-containing n=1 Tax=Trichoderma cornu-damae TaxID=654480 RepID=A0A9P8TZE0_9HYPO|nr:n-terminal binuclear zn cluster-containing dna binding domain-containing [Trichoderma cornu-damae]
MQMQPEGGDGRRPLTNQRLPVNPRRHKVAPEQRKRVATACNSCNVRRVKCSGGSPCGQCSASNRECVYPVPVEKVNIPRAEMDELRRKVEVYERALREAIPDPARRQDLLYHASATPEGLSPSPGPLSPSQPFPSGGSSRRQGGHSVKSEPEDEQTTGRLLQDPDGTARFLGETSGATFLDHLKELLGAVLPLVQGEPQLSHEHDGSAFLSSLGRYYTDDSRPLAERDPMPISLPSGEDLGTLLSKLRHLIQDGNGEWPSGGIYWWGELNNVPAPVASPPSSSDADLNEYRYLAFYHAALAVITRANTLSEEVHGSASTPSLSEAYFARAAVLVGNPLDITRCCTIGDVATLCLMSAYLIEMNRRDAAYMHVAAAMHICIMLGVHRGLVDERGKRVFWTVYIMDRWLSCLMGRPHIIMDDAIRIQLPADAPSMPPAAGLKAHVELSRISGYVVCNTYRVAPWEEARGGLSKQPDKAIWMLQQWQSTLPPRLQLSPDGLSSDPACCFLHMRYNMLLILAIRPLFLGAVKRSVARRLMVQTVEPYTHSEHLKLCIAAARRNIRLGRQVTTVNISRRSPLHAEQHYSFNATVCLILEDLISEEEVSEEEKEARNRDIIFGIEVEEEGLTNFGQTSSNTLRHLWTLARRLTSSIVQPQEVSNVQQVEQQLAPPMMTTLPGPGYSMPPMQIGEDHALYDELVAWVDDEWPMYNTGLHSGFMQ